METTTKLFFVSLFFFLSQAMASSAEVTNNTNTMQLTYIKNKCGITLYPSICYHSLNRYASNIREDPGRLATAAMSLSLSRTTRLSSYLYNVSLLGDFGSDRLVPSALQDCIDNVKDATAEIKSSLKQIKEAASSHVLDEFRFQMSNVQTWMSSALTDQETCTDGFEGISGWPRKAEMFDNVNKVKKYTSNALALVNNYIHSKTM